MSNQTNNRKKSEFLGSSTLPAGTYLDFVSDGVNYKIDLASFQAALNVTGTLEQAGASTAVPVLQTVGTVNKIRNIEAGSGIQASISPQNGVTVKHNFVNGMGGVNVLTDETLAQPKFRNIAAGSGINVSIGSNDEIVVASSGIPATSKTVEVSSLADLPAAEAGVITLADDTDYLFINDISTSNRFVVNGTTSLRSAAAALITLTYTGSGDMFTCDTPVLKIQNMRLSCASGRMFNATGGGTGTIQLVEVNLIADTVGLFNNMLITRFHSVAFLTVSSGGLTFTGTNSNVFMDTCIIFLTAGTFINLGAATFTQANFENLIFESAGAGTTFLSGTTASGNIISGSLGRVTNCSSANVATQLSGVSVDDARWEFQGNDSIQNTRADALLSMQGNSTETVISVAGTPVLVAGTWVVEDVSQMTGTTGGRSTYDGSKGAKLPITASLSVEPSVGSNLNLSVYWALNGTVITNSKRTATASSGSPTNITIPWQLSLTSGDYLELFVANEDNTNNILVSSAVSRVD